MVHRVSSSFLRSCESHAPFRLPYPLYPRRDTVQDIVSCGHSRLPVHMPDDRRKIVGVRFPFRILLVGRLLFKNGVAVFSALHSSCPSGPPAAAAPPLPRRWSL